LGSGSEAQSLLANHSSFARGFYLWQLGGTSAARTASSYSKK
jgi:hypothetical protein